MDGTLRRLASISVIALLLVHSAPCLAEDAGRERLSQEALQQDLTDLRTQRTRLRTEITALNSASSAVDRMLTAIRSASLKDGSLDADIEKLKFALEKLNSLPDTTLISDESDEVMSLYIAVEGLESAVPDRVSEIIEEQDGQIALLDADTQSALSRLKQSLQPNRGNVGRFSRRFDLPEALLPSAATRNALAPANALLKSIPVIPTQQPKAKREFATPIQSALASVGAMNSTAWIQDFDAAKRKLEEIATAEKSRLLANVAEKQQQFGIVDTQYNDVNKVLLARESEKGSQQTVNEKLVYAVPTMIVALLIMFLGLRTFTDDVVKSFIEQRAFVEVISMAFLLLTIIILGTSGKLLPEALGTLLGAIAGYIFGRSDVAKKGVATPPPVVVP